MKPVLVSLLCAFTFFRDASSQPFESYCSTVDTGQHVELPLVDVELSLVAIYVDFYDSRKPDGSLPTVDADTALFPGSAIDAVGGMGWVKIFPGVPGSPLRKKIRKYTYEDYWDQLFSDSTYVDNDSLSLHPHPDWDVHQARVYGSMRDYYREATHGNVIVAPGLTGAGPPDKYNTGIANRFDEADGKKYIRWIRLARPKSYYRPLAGPDNALILEAIDSVRHRHARGPDDPEYIAFNPDTYAGRYVIVGAGANIGGFALGFQGQPYTVSEKFFFYDNSDPRSWFEGITHHVHEFGHTIGLHHAAYGSFEPMHWGGLNGEEHYRCPPHFNPLTKLFKGWIPPSSVVAVHSGMSLSLQPSHMMPSTSSPSIALITVYGQVGRNADYTHSEYFAVEYRTRSGFNRFSGGSDLTPGDPFQGGALVWLKVPSVSIAAWTIALKVPDYGPDYREDQDPADYLTAGRSLDSTETLPNSSSWSGVKTGIRLATTTANPALLILQVAYQIDVPPQYQLFKPGAADSVWSGSVYLEGSHESPVRTILPGTIIDLASGGGQGDLTIRRGSAIGSPLNPIVFRGVGYGAHRTKYHSVVATANDQPSLPELAHCRFEDGCYGVTIGDLQGVNRFTPHVHDCSFLRCDSDIRIAGSHMNPPIDLSVALNNAFSSLSIRFSVELAASNLHLPSGSRMSMESGPSGPLHSELVLRSNRILTVAGQLVLGSNANIAFDPGSQLRVLGAVSVTDTTTWTLPSSADVRFDPGATLALGWGSRVVSRGALAAIGSDTEPVSIASVSEHPKTHEYWQMLDLKGGPNILRHCVIQHSQNGVYFNNTSSTLLLDSCTIRNGSGYAVQAFNTSMNPNSLLMRDCVIDSNMNGVTAQNGRIDVVQTSDQPGIRHNGYGIVAWTGGKVYMQNARITNNNNWGVYVNGSTAQVNFSPNGLAPGLNRLRDNADGQLWVQSGSAFLGSTNTICICDPIDPEEPTMPDRDDGSGGGSIGGSLEVNCVPPCYVAPVVYGGFNYVSGDWSAQKYWIKTQAAGVAARKTYWGLPQVCPPPAGAFSGTVDRTECLTGGGESLALLPGGGEGDPHVEGFLDSTSVIALLQTLREDLLLGTSNARRALHELASLCGRGGGFSRFLRMDWRQLLELSLTRNLPVELKNLLKAYRLQDMMDTRQYDEAIEYGNTLSGSQNDELWFHAQATLVHAFAASGRLAEAHAQFNGMKSRGASVNPQGTNQLQYLLSLESAGGTAERMEVGRAVVVSGVDPVPAAVGVSLAYPNPFNPTTQIRFELSEPATVSLAIYDVLGRRIVDLASGGYEAGYHSVTWNATGVASGVYLARFTATTGTGSVTYTKTHKLVLMK